MQIHERHIFEMSEIGMSYVSVILYLRGHNLIYFCLVTELLIMNKWCTMASYGLTCIPYMIPYTNDMEGAVLGRTLFPLIAELIDEFIYL